MYQPRKTGALLTSIKEIIVKAKQTAYRNTNSILLKTYWEIGRLIVEDEQRGKVRAEYGKGVLKMLSKQLTLEFGKGYDETNLRNIRAFYLSFPIWNAVRTELSWTHYRILSRIENESLRQQYLAYAIEGSWDTRALQRNITTQYIDRIVAPAPLENPTIQGLVKDPYIFEFLGMQAHASISESHIESGLINHLQQFLMELGKGFAFVSRQEHIVTDTSDFFIDLVFYNYFLKCFVLIELKTGKLTHAAIGQMDMYVRMYDDMKRNPDDNPTIGIILCTEKDEAMVKYSVLSGNEQLFASKYRLYLPREEELVQLLEEDMVEYGNRC